VQNFESISIKSANVSGFDKKEEAPACLVKAMSLSSLDESCCELLLGPCVGNAKWDLKVAIYFVVKKEKEPIRRR